MLEFAETSSPNAKCVSKDFRDKKGTYGHFGQRKESLAKELSSFLQKSYPLSFEWASMLSKTKCMFVKQQWGIVFNESKLVSETFFLRLKYNGYCNFQSFCDDHFNPE